MKLFDEYHQYSESENRRTIWHRFNEADEHVHYIFSLPNPEMGGGRVVISTDYIPLAKTLKQLMDEDLSTPPDVVISETHWVFYTNILDGDAINDNVRFTICIQFKGSKYKCNINMSDFIFATSFDNVMALKLSIEEYINV